MTYTYDNANLKWTKNGHMTLYKKHHQLFMKRLRKYLKKEGYDVQLKYFMCGEYGGQTQRPHYHAVLFDLPEKFEVNEHLIEEIWSHGHVQIDLVSTASIAYVCGYVNKQTYWNNLGDDDDRQREYRNMSQRLGANYLTDAKVKSMREKKNPFLTLSDGQKMSVPRYYKDKVYSDAEKLEISQKALDYMETNPIFATIKEKHDFLNTQAIQKRRDASRNRRKI